jgi:hypothetical protein
MALKKTLLLIAGGFVLAFFIPLLFFADMFFNEAALDSTPDESEQTGWVEQSVVSPDSVLEKEHRHERVNSASIGTEIQAGDSHSVHRPSRSEQPQKAKYDAELSENEIGEDGMAIVDGEKQVVDWEKFFLYRMHQNGWSKPEDVPVTYSEPPEGNPDGVYIWWHEKSYVPPEEIPPHVTKLNRELKGELDRAFRAEDHKEMRRLMKEIRELNAPYPRGGVNFHARMVNIPLSWRSYFKAIVEKEKANLYPQATNR